MLLHGVMPAQVCQFLPNFTRYLAVRVAELLLNAICVYSPVYRLTCFATHFAVIHKQKDSFPAIIQVKDENVKHYLHQYQPLKCSLRHHGVHLCPLRHTVELLSHLCCGQ